MDSFDLIQRAKQRRGAGGRPLMFQGEADPNLVIEPVQPQTQTPAAKVGQLGLARPTVPTAPAARPAPTPAPRRAPLANELDVGPQRTEEQGPPEPAARPQPATQQPSDAQRRFNDAKARLDAELANIDANPRGSTRGERWARGLSIAGAWLSGGAEAGMAAQERYGADAKRQAAQNRFAEETDSILKAMELERAGIDLDVAKEALADHRSIRADEQDPNGIQATVARKLITDGLTKAQIPGIDSSMLEGKTITQLRPILNQMVEMGVVGKGALEAELNALKMVTMIQTAQIAQQGAQIALNKEQRDAEKARQEELDRQNQQRTRLQSDYEKADTVLRAIDQMLPKINAVTTGVGAAVQDALPFSQVIKAVSGTNDLNALADTVRGNLATDDLLAIKAQGGTFGALSNTELGLLASLRGSLDTKQSDDQLRGTLVEIYGLMEKARGEATAQMQQRGMQAPQSTAPSSGRRVVNSNDDAAYEALPSGTVFYDENGKQWRKP